MLLKTGDVVQLKDNSKKSVKFTGAFEANSMREVPVWLEVDKGNFKGIVKDLPKREDITSQISEHLIVELYTK
jgi:small subunit ribosomal protein S4